MTKVVELKNIYKKYGNKVILKDFNLTLNKGEFLCVVGSSGSGKTTIMRMINGLIIPDGGEVLINGKNIKEENILSLRRKIGYAIQGNALFPHMTIYENIGYVPKLENKGKEEIDDIVNNMLNLVDLPNDIKNKYPHELSGGQQQRVGIARAYANKPNILLMDEPFGAVDSITRHNLQKDLKKIHGKNNCTIVFITHDIAEALKLSTHILVLNEGKIEQYGTSEEIKNNPKTDFVKNLIEMAK